MSISLLLHPLLPGSSRNGQSSILSSTDNKLTKNHRLTFDRRDSRRLANPEIVQPNKVAASYAYPPHWPPLVHNEVYFHISSMGFVYWLDLGCFVSCNNGDMQVRMRLRGGVPHDPLPLPGTHRPRHGKTGHEERSDNRRRKMCNDLVLLYGVPLRGRRLSLPWLSLTNSLFHDARD